MHIAVLTSGGDAPGMNAAIRAVVRCSRELSWRVTGVKYGFKGLCAGSFEALGRRDVGGIIHQGGTFLGSARHPDLRKTEEQERAINRLKERGIDALVVIGGNGSQTGSQALATRGLPVVGIASTIDNDLVGTDISIGVDTALNVALESIDRLRTTAVSHRRVVLVEVMGRQSGYLALNLGIAGGAEALTIPEHDVDIDALVDEVQRFHDLKKHAVIIVAEGAKHNAAALARRISERPDIAFGVRVTVLGHVQRGGVPTAFDRLLASRLGAGAVAALADGEAGVLVGLLGGKVSRTPLAEVAGRTRDPDLSLLSLAAVLAH